MESIFVLKQKSRRVVQKVREEYSGEFTRLLDLERVLDCFMKLQILEHV